MTIPEEAKSTGYAFGVSNHSRKIADEMKAVMAANSLALAEMLASPRDGSVPVRYRKTVIDAP